MLWKIRFHNERANEGSLKPLPEYGLSQGGKISILLNVEARTDETNSAIVKYIQDICEARR